MAQELSLILTLQAIVQGFNPRDNLKRHFRIINMHLMTDRQRFKRAAHMRASVSPLCPERIPNFPADLNPLRVSGQSNFLPRPWLSEALQDRRVRRGANRRS
jgi:hypothetical protein